MAAMKDDPPPKTPLGEQLRALAEGGKHPQTLELYARARDLDVATYARGQAFDAAALARAWVRARRLWCELTGEEMA